jgi:putative nucleotidyltransferase with HDIG domain
MNFALVTLVAVRRHGGGASLSLFWEYLPTEALNIALAVAGAAIYVRVGLPGIVFALAALSTFGYMAELLERAREQAKLAEERADQNLTLSYGVLSGLIYALDKRDRRAARHAVAVARFARDIAAEAGLSEREQDLAHTAGLLHDIGQFAFNDRVNEPGYQLNDEDVERIQGHPEVGEELLKNLVGYGPVADIVRSHHERIDGIGYPDGLLDEEIPVLSRIIAVAEVYDTLTSPDTYRPVTLSPLQALNELRRVAGSQLDSQFVDALSRALGHKAFDDHVVKAADFDAELDLERRIREARRQAS